MKQVSLTWAAAGLALLLFAPAHAAAPRSFDLWIEADIAIGADGRIEALEWQGDTPGHRILNVKVEPLVRRWQFVPGTLDGEPMRTSTSLYVRVLGTQQPDGSIMLKIGGASTGPSTRRRVIPSYPPAAVRAGRSAIVVAVINVSADGVSSVESLDFSSRREGLREHFLAAAESAAKQWRFDPERVGDRAVATRVRIPFDFCLSGDRWCEKQARSTATSSADPQSGANGRPVALDSVVRLLTEVRGQEI